MMATLALLGSLVTGALVTLLVLWAVRTKARRVVLVVLGQHPLDEAADVAGSYGSFLLYGDIPSRRLAAARMAMLADLRDSVPKETLLEVVQLLEEAQDSEQVQTVLDSIAYAKAELQAAIATLA